ELVLGGVVGGHQFPAAGDRGGRGGLGRRRGRVGVGGVARGVGGADAEAVLGRGRQAAGGVGPHVGADGRDLGPRRAVGAALDLEARLVGAVVRPREVDLSGRRSRRGKRRRGGGDRG